jgi:hypothetical protein
MGDPILSTGFAMKPQFTTARFVFHLISAFGYLVVTFAPGWVFFVGILGSAIGVPGGAGGWLLALVQAMFGVTIIAGAQLGLAQVAIANNTAAILALLQSAQNPPAALSATLETDRKEPWARKPKE